MSALNHLTVQTKLNPAKTPQASAPSLPRHNNNVRTPWTGERVDLLIALWAEGFGPTTPKIAERLNELPGGLVTDDAVIGKIARLGLAPKDLELRKKQTRKSQIATKRRKIVEQKKPARVRAPKVNPKQFQGRSVSVALCVSLIEIRHGQCGYIEEPSSLLCCGRERATGSLWCADHREICTKPVSRAPKDNKRLPDRHFAVTS